MPKSSDKTKGAKKRNKAPITSNANSENDGDRGELNTGPKKKKTQTKRGFLEGIEMSRELAKKVKHNRSSRPRISKNTEPRVCGNGKPMPSLAELEAMYTDSEGDEEPKTTETTTIVRCGTPELDFKVKDDPNLPTTLQEMASKAIEIISKKIVILDDSPRPAVIPPKKRKKPEVPYIVGCKDRPQVPWAPKTSFCVGSEEYGVDQNGSNSDDDCCPKKRKKRGKKVNISKSIFNAKSDEIAELLKQSETSEPVQAGSPDSNDTVEYDFTSNPPTMPRSFSPLPSTSKDNETILKNDKLFNESLHCENLSNDSQNEIEIIDMPCETIIIDDSIMNTSNTKTERISDNFEDDCCIIVEPDFRNKRNSESKADSPIDDIYSSIDLTMTYDDEVYEICDDDIESVMAENKAILEKDKNKNTIDTVTSVDNSLIVIESEQGPNVLNSNPNESGLHSNDNGQLCGRTRNLQPIEIEDNTEIQIVQEPESNAIAEVVTNFFNQSQDNSSTSSAVESLVDRSDTSGNLLNRLSSFISSLDILIRGHRPNRNLNTSNEVLVIEDSPRSYQSDRTQNITPNCGMSSVTHALVTSPRHKNKNQQKQVTNSTAQETSPNRDLQPRSSGRSLGDCPICMDSLENSAIASTLCGHIFCMNCIKAAFRANGKKCPTCRKALKGVGYHQLFL